MEFSVKTTSPADQRSACLVLGVFERRKLSAAAQQVDGACNHYLSQLLKQGDMDGTAGQTRMLYDLEGIAAPRVLLVGCGKEKEFGLRQFKKACKDGFQALNDSGAHDAVSYLCDLPVKQRSTAENVRFATETALHGEYKYTTTRSKNGNHGANLHKVIFNVSDKNAIKTAQLALQIARAIATGSNTARELGNLPANVCTPTFLANSAQKNARQVKGMKVKVLKQAEIEKLQMGAFLSVAKGSRQPPRLIVIEYQGGKKGDKPHVLVGKGVTFDAGGISIKPAAAMDEMKFDMCGAASVLGTMTTVGELQLPLNVVAIVPTCENLPDGNANKPGDVVTSMSGQTIEVLNTDAEGRLILCDALTYSERYSPKAVIDVATLTGACVVALGKHPCGLLSNDDKLTASLLQSGERSHDRAWHMPLWEEYQEQLKSNFADMANIGGRDAGTITAACFLARFTEKLKWAHLDIAGVAWDSGSKKGATGRPVPLLSQYLLDQCGKKYALS